MDPLAHTLVGATLAQTRLRNGAAAMAVPAGVLAANAPDVDAVTMFVSRDLSLGFRRGWTHGVLAMAVLPLVLTVPARARPGGGAVGAGRRHGRGPLLQLTSARVLVAAACPARGPSTRGAERFTAALLTMQDGAAAVDLLAIPLPGNVFRRGIVAVYPNAYRFHELDWLDAPPPRQTIAPVTPVAPERPIVEPPCPPAWGIR